MRKLQPLSHPTLHQIALLRDARAGALRRIGRFWRRRATSNPHAGMTAAALVKRRFLAVENDFLFITPEGRAFLERYESRARISTHADTETARVA